MKLGVGSDSFSYSPTEVKTASPLHSLRVTQGRITLDTRKFTLEVSGDNVVLRTEDKTSSTESKSLASDLRTLLTEAAKKQVKDVMEGTPIDLSEMLAATEEVLARHG
jgi:branched-subunit amino acid aminotransferase/4-amino-4-deoxychorismate lyase